MLLKSNDGICCDLCSMVFRDKFTYYSMDVREVKDNAIVGTSSYDMCSQCFGTYSAAIIKHQRPQARASRNKPPVAKCELSDAILFKHFCLCKLAKVDVHILNTITCNKCGAISKISNEPCKCSSTSFKRNSIVSTMDDFLEFRISSDEYEKFRNKNVSVSGFTAE